MASPHSRDMRRELEMVALFKSGKTLREIAEVHGVSRERIRQLLQRHGVTGRDGGCHVTSARQRTERAEARRARRDAKCFRVYGCSYAEVMAINRGMGLSDIGSPAFHFRERVRNARREGVEFRLTLKQWVDLFEDAGGIENLGLAADGLVLARIDKAGGFTTNNVRVMTHAENSRETRLQAMRRQRTNRDSGVGSHAATVPAARAAFHVRQERP